VLVSWCAGKQEADMPGQRLNHHRPLIAAAAVLAALAALVASPARPATPPTAAAPAGKAAIARTDLQRHDLGIPGREAIQVRVDFEPSAIAPRHSHPGEEIVYVLAGALEYRLDGKPAVTLRAGDVLFIPAGAVHAVTNVGSDRASELATYIVEKGKPLITLAK
jgi:quercetin dioxygenase-like cupin family protein